MKSPVSVDLLSRAVAELEDGQLSENSRRALLVLALRALNARGPKIEAANRARQGRSAEIMAGITAAVGGLPVELPTDQIVDAVFKRIQRDGPGAYGLSKIPDPRTVARHVYRMRHSESSLPRIGS